MASANKVPRSIVVEALNEHNYPSWAACMKAYLMGKGLWDIVDGSEPEPNPNQATPETVKEWRRRNAKALHSLQVSCGSRMYSYISMETSAKAAWDRLASIRRWHDHKITSQLSKGKDEKNIPYMTLYKAVINGDGEGTKQFLALYPEAVRAKISTDGGTALHNAVLHRQVHVVEHLVDVMLEKDLELRTSNQYGATALHIAATAGKVQIAEALVKKNRSLTCVRNSYGYIPVCIAALYGDDNMLNYLYSVTPEQELDPNTSNSGATLLSLVVNAENYGFALNLLKRFPELAITKDITGKVCLNVLAQKLSAFRIGSKLSSWQKWMYNFCQPSKFIHENEYQNDKDEQWRDVENLNDHFDACRDRRLISSGQVLILISGILRATSKFLGVNKMYKLKVKHAQAKELLTLICKQLEMLNSTQHLESLVMPAMFQAIELGNVEFIIDMINFYPALLWSATELGGLFHAAVAHRQETIWNLIYSTPKEIRDDLASMEDKFGNNVLHIAGTLAPAASLHRVAGPAMQMQCELQWFKAVEHLVRPNLKEHHNKEGKTPHTLFTEQHHGLAKEAKKWMKDTATSCMVVATLIATVMFEGAIDIPGGQNDENGLSFIRNKFYYQFYMTSDAVSLISATVSVLMFLSIFTSRYADGDFLESLPKRFIIGLATLFFSMGAMMIAFAFTVFINLRTEKDMVSPGFPPISLLAVVPVALFGFLQFPLFMEMIRSSYGPSIFRPTTQVMFLKRFQ